MPTVVVLLLLAFATPRAHAGLYEWCVDFLVREDSSYARAVEDPEEEARFAALAEERPVPVDDTPWPKPPSFIEDTILELQRRVLAMTAGLDLRGLAGKDVRLALTGYVGDAHYPSIAFAETPQRVLFKRDLPRAERIALDRLLRRPESRRPFGEGFRESLIVVAHLRNGYWLLTTDVKGDQDEVPLAGVQAAVEAIRRRVPLSGSALRGLTYVHVHPEANVPLTESDVGLARRTARAFRRELPTGGFVAIVAGGARNPDGLAFRFASFPRGR